jgi:hypothetical protein
VVQCPLCKEGNAVRELPREPLERVLPRIPLPAARVQGLHSEALRRVMRIRVVVTVTGRIDASLAQDRLEEEGLVPLAGCRACGVNTTLVGVKAPGLSAVWLKVSL